jgi:GNAT superfamily N-acetyltransferase
MPHPRVRGVEHLNLTHDLVQFRNERHTSLDDWLIKRALVSESLSARTYVTCSAAEPQRVVGYHAISAAQEERSELPSASSRKNMPEKVPLMLLGRLAVDARFQGIGLGRSLLSHALRNCFAISQMVGVRGIVASAIDDSAVRFYESSGFRLSPLGTRMMFMKMKTIEALFTRPYPSTSS